MIGDRWGVSDGEVLRSYPCDKFVTSSALQVCTSAWIHRREWEVDRVVTKEVPPGLGRWGC